MDISRFKKLNSDIQFLANRMMEDQELVKLIHYPHQYPLKQPAISGYKNVLDKRLLLFTPKIPLAGEDTNTQEDGTYVMVRPFRINPSRGGYYAISLLVFDIYCQKDIRTIYYKDEDGDEVKSDRALMIVDRIENVMKDTGIGIGEDSMDVMEEISNRNMTFSGYRMGYVNVDFRR